ncbi:hypothetical protein [Streptomyces mexicanus]|uniref:hypothetical protein n=1 Tax=Streptomyces mexicanus TaxID=178566 RepID=UPI0036C509A9
MAGAALRVLTDGRRRLALGTSAALATVAAGPAAVAARKSRQVHLATAPSGSAVVGTWQREDGRGRIRLDLDGRFRATDLPRVLAPGCAAGDGTGTAGIWSLDAAGGLPALRPAGACATRPEDPGPGVVERGGDIRLCVGSDNPGVLSDALLRRVPG